MQPQMNMRYFLLPAVLTVSACAASSQEGIAIPPVVDGSDVRLGQAAYVDGPIVKPMEILEDSRCPMNARCIWAGRVRVKMLWLRGKNAEEFELTLGQPHQLADGEITLTSVRPEKRTDVTLKSEDYRFSFSFAGGY